MEGYNQKKMADIVVIDMPLLDTRRGKDLLGTFLSDIVLQVLSFVAENERIMIKQRQAEGIAVAKAKGVRFGPKPIPLPDDFEKIYQELKSKRINVKEAARICNMSRSTLYNRLKQYKDAKDNNPKK